jgi:hypothetical protein
MGKCYYITGIERQGRGREGEDVGRSDGMQSEGGHTNRFNKLRLTKAMQCATGCTKRRGNGHAAFAS